MEAIEHSSEHFTAMANFKDFMLRQFGFVRAKLGKGTHYGALGLVMVEE